MLIVHLCFDLCPSSDTGGSCRWQQEELQMSHSKDTDLAPGWADNLDLQCETGCRSPGLSVLCQSSIWAVLSSQTPPILLMVDVDSIWVFPAFLYPRNHSPMVTICQKLIATFWKIWDFIQEGLLTWGHTLTSLPSWELKV